MLLLRVVSAGSRTNEAAGFKAADGADGLIGNGSPQRKATEMAWGKEIASDNCADGFASADRVIGPGKCLGNSGDGHLHFEQQGRAQKR